MIKSIEIRNFKGIEHANINIISKLTGIYGENGVGKTTVLEVMKLFQADYCFEHVMEDKLIDYLKKGTDYFSYAIDIELDNIKFVFYRKYNFEGSQYVGYEEEVRYKYLKQKERLKKIYNKVQTQSVASQVSYKFHSKAVKKSLEQLTNSEYERLKSHRSDFFDINHEEYEAIDEGGALYNSIKTVLRYITNIQFIDLETQAISNLGVVIPIHHHYESNDFKSHGIIPIKSYDKYYSEEEFKAMKIILDEISRILEVITDGKKVVVEKYKDRLNENSEMEISIAVFIEDDEKKIPIEHESTGVVKLVSMLSSITSLITCPSSFVLIDELDAHVFEYLLSIIISTLQIHIQGTLIFTSHNLTLFESLHKDSILIASKDCNNNVIFSRFINISKTTNIRDLYIRLQNYGEQDDIQKSSIDKAKIEYLFEDIELGLL